MEKTADTIELFRAEVSFSKSSGDRRIVRGYASTESLDQQGEEILQNGLDFAPLLKSGFLNYDHQYQEIAGGRMPIIVGYPTSAVRDEKGWIVEGELLKSDDPRPTSEQMRLANELWEFGLALQKSGGARALAYSVEGSVLERRGSKIVRAAVKHLAVTHKPVNAECNIELFAKSFCCGNCNKGGHRCSHGIEKAMSTESAGPLMLENLHRGMGKHLYGHSKCTCYDSQTGLFAKGATGALEHMTKCLGHPHRTGMAFLTKLIKGSADHPDLAALVRRAGIAG